MSGRFWLIAAAVLACLILGSFGARRWWQASPFPPVSREVVQLTPEKRHVLERLRAEQKFQPNDFPPLGYTGAETPEDERVAVAAVDAVINGVLAGPDGPRAAPAVSAEIGEAMDKVEYLATEDRDRTADYLIEIWYILGFKGSTGRFAYGSAFVPPPGHAEPLPPGWKSPEEPRKIG
jgi:hypothetical protein